MEENESKFQNPTDEPTQHQSLSQRYQIYQNGQIKFHQFQLNHTLLIDLLYSTCKHK